MEALRIAIANFSWFLSEAVRIQNPLADIFLFPLVLWAAVAFPRNDRTLQRKLLSPIVCLPPIWIFVGLWGGAFRWDVQQHVSPRPDPGWLLLPVNLALPLTLLLGGYFVWRLKDARRFALINLLINAYLVFFIGLMATMAITGIWM